MGLAAWVLQRFQFESPIFTSSMVIFLSGSALSWLLPSRYRVCTLVLVSICGGSLLFPFKIWAGLIAMLLSFTFILNSPIHIVSKILWVVLTAILAGLTRQLFPQSNYANSLIPVFGAVFSVRTISYIRQIQKPRVAFRWDSSFAYFLILPNFVTWFFPIIDFRKFSDEALKPRNEGVVTEAMFTVFNGIVHLFLYRLLAITWDMPFQQIGSVENLCHYLVVTFLHYLRISGIFHLVVGAISLYGIALPKTHDKYFFPESCLDVFRRMNIYWKDFMVENVFKPLLHFGARWGETRALFLAIVGVFVSSCVLHRYIYLWPSGTFEIRFEDLLFWFCLALWTGWDLFRERVARHKKIERRENRGAEFILKARNITLTLFVFNLLWIVWNSPSLNDLIALLALVRPPQMWEFTPLLFYPAMGLLGALSFTFEKEWAQWNGPTLNRYAYLIFGVLLLILASPYFQSRLSEGPKAIARKLTNSSLQVEYENEKRSYDYYEGLKNRASTPVDEDELPIGPRSIFESVGDFRRRQYRRSVREIFMGHLFETNRWGMPMSKEVNLTKAPGQLRVAILGHSLSAPYGIETNRDWPRLAESLLKKEGFSNIEILNFSVIGYPSVVMPYVFETQVMPFKPDLLVHIGSSREFWVNGFTVGYALRAGLKVPDPELYRVLGVSGPNDFLARHFFTFPGPELRRQIFDWGMAKLGRTIKEMAPSMGMMYFMVPTVFEGSKEQHLRTREEELYILDHAKNAGFLVFDRSDIFFGQDLYQVSLGDDLYNGNHFSEAGHSQIADVFVIDFKKFFREWKSKL